MSVSSRLHFTSAEETLMTLQHNVTDTLYVFPFPPLQINTQKVTSDDLLKMHF